jgi:hypothetical protein
LGLINPIQLKLTGNFCQTPKNSKVCEIEVFLISSHPDYSKRKELQNTFRRNEKSICRSSKWKMSIKNA